MHSRKYSARRLSAAVTAGALSAVMLAALALPAQAAPMAPAAVQATVQAGATYTVKSGDSLWAIAASHGISLASLFSANNMGTSTIIYPGQRIKLAATRAPAPAPAAVAAPASRSAAVYVVKSGDTLSRIASSHGVSLAAVFAANNMSMSTIIYPGQSIKLAATKAAPRPAAPVPIFVIRIVPSPAATTPAPAPAPAAQVQTPAAPAPAALSSATLQQMVAGTARSMGVDPSLALAFAEQESSFRQNVVSSAGAIGTMQVMPTSGTWASQLVGRTLDLNNAQDNITAGVAIIKALVATSPSLQIAVASYYQGQYSVLHRGMYDDTKVYVAQVLQRQANFR